MKLQNLHVLKQNKKKMIVYMIFCFLLFVLLIILPSALWLTSGVKNIGITSIRGDSMEPTIVNNTIMYVNETQFERGEVVVFECPSTDKYPSSSRISLLKRIVGLPGETIEITADGVLIDGELLAEPYTDNQSFTLDESNDIAEIVLSDDEYFLLGDNRESSFDSRHIGAVHSSYFMYGLTDEPNSYTYKVFWIALTVLIVNVISIAILARAILIKITRPKVQIHKKKNSLKK